MAKRFKARSIAKSASIMLLLIATGWLAFSAAAIRALPAASLRQSSMLNSDPEVVLDNATRALVERRGILPNTTLAAVRRAAAEVPLDARPYLILGHQALLDRQNDRALRILEAGQRLDPRQRLIHVLLLDRYLREERFTMAGRQFAVLARLVGQAQPQTAKLLAQMILQPQTRNATLRTLRDDPTLERDVLTALARTDADPAMLFAIATPGALATASAPDGWGTALLLRLAANGRLPNAKRVWQRLYAIPASRASLPLYDPDLQGWPGGAPFNWSLAASSIGAVDRQAGEMVIDYYGRDSGELAGQTLTLIPGRYRLSLSARATAPSQADALTWTLTCTGDPRPPLVTLPLSSLGTAARRYSAAFSVPGGCTGQRLVLSGTAAEFASTTRAAIGDLKIAALP